MMNNEWRMKECKFNENICRVYTHPEMNNPQEICGSVARNDMVPGVVDWNVNNIR